MRKTIYINSVGNYKFVGSEEGWKRLSESKLETLCDIRNSAEFDVNADERTITQRIVVHVAEDWDGNGCRCATVAISCADAGFTINSEYQEWGACPEDNGARWQEAQEAAGWEDLTHPEVEERLNELLLEECSEFFSR